MVALTDTPAEGLAAEDGIENQVQRVRITVRAAIESFRSDSAEQILLRACRIDLLPGRVHCLVGSSGAGKTTLLRVLAGLTTGHLRGQVAYLAYDAPTDLAALKERGAIGLLTDGACLLPWLKVSDNLRLPSKLNPSLAAPTDDAVSSILEMLHLSPKALSKYPDELSFGMRRRTALARVLLYAPSVLYLDEAFTGLDPNTAQAVAAALRDHVPRTKSTCLLVTHDIDAAVSVGDDFTALSPMGSTEPIAGHPSRETLLDSLVAVHAKHTDSAEGHAL